jgi:Holliday junction resolvase RusA-like endonuclease
MIEFQLPLEPNPEGRPRFTKRGFAYKPQRSRDFEDDFRNLTEELRPPELLTGPLSVELIFYLKRPKKPKHPAYPIVRPDIDNYAKAVLDGMNPVKDDPTGQYSGIYKDDSQVVELWLRKAYCVDNEPPSIHVRIEEL